MTTTPTTSNPLPGQLEVTREQARVLRERRDEQQANLTNLRGQLDAERDRARGLEGGTSPELRALQTVIGKVETLVDQADQRLAALDREIETLDVGRQA